MPENTRNSIKMIIWI